MQHAVSDCVVFCVHVWPHTGHKHLHKAASPEPGQHPERAVRSIRGAQDNIGGVGSRLNLNFKL